MSVSGNFATARRATVDGYSLAMAERMLKTRPGAFQSVSMATGVPIDKLKSLNQMAPAIRPIKTANPLVMPPAARIIQRMVCAHFEVSIDELLSYGMARRLVVPRQVSMWLCYTLSSSSLPQIARYHGRTDHGCVHHAVATINKRVRGKDPAKIEIMGLRTEVAKALTEADLRVAA